MELRKIRTILSGLKVSVEIKRQAWIEYGGLLAQCPHKQGAKIGEWVREQKLDFITERQERAAAKRLFNCIHLYTVKLDDCPHSNPVHVISWLQDQGQIEVDRKDKPEPVEIESESKPHRLSNAEIELRNAFNSDEFEMRDGFITIKPIGSDWNDAITERILGMNDANHGDVLGYADGYQLVVQYKKIRVAVRKAADALDVEAIS